MYPNKPDTFLTVDGIDLFDLYGMVLVDGYTMPPPEPKTYMVDLPGGNGSLDLSEAMFGDVAYNNRKHTYQFYVIDIKDPDGLIRDITNLLHGKRRKYVFSLEPRYTYTGRFKIASTERQTTAMGLMLVISVEVDTEPFKKLQPVVIRASAMGGTVVRCLSGRMPVHPTIETTADTVVVFNGEEIKIPAGTWTLPRVTFRQGVNDIYVNTFPIYNFYWPDDNSFTWGEIGSTPIYQLTKRANSETNMTIHTWDMLFNNGTTWPTVEEDADNVLWKDWSYISLSNLNVQDVYLTYEWGDL